jgi:hypothetical protein
MKKNNKKVIIKFHGTEVKNIVIKFLQSQKNNPDAKVVEEFNVSNSNESCETINIQVVADFVTISYYQNEEANKLVKRELIPAHTVEFIQVFDIIE